MRQIEKKKPTNEANTSAETVDRIDTFLVHELEIPDPCQIVR